MFSMKFENRASKHFFLQLLLLPGQIVFSNSLHPFSNFYNSLDVAIFDKYYSDRNRCKNIQCMHFSAKFDVLSSISIKIVRGMRVMRLG